MAFMHGDISRIFKGLINRYTHEVKNIVEVFEYVEKSWRIPSHYQMAYNRVRNPCVRLMQSMVVCIYKVKAILEYLTVTAADAIEIPWLVNAVRNAHEQFEDSKNKKKLYKKKMRAFLRALKRIAVRRLRHWPL